MAAVGGENAEREYRKLLTDCLLNAEVSNSYTLDEFKEFFPRKYRVHQDIKTLYDAYQTKRKHMRDTVLMNIRLHCRQREQEDNEVTDDKYKSDIEDLEAREQILQEEIDAMKQDIDLVKESIGSCADTLEKRRIFSDLDRTDFDTRKLKKIKTRTLTSSSDR